MKHLNTAFRGIHKATDVLSFPQLSAEGQKSGKKTVRKSVRAKERKSGRKIIYKDGKDKETSELTNLRPSGLILGDIVISVPAAEEQAEMSGRGFYDEIYRLLIHGTMHLLGYSHEKSRYTAAAMRKKERELLNAVKKMG